jgi:hypothetical protein
LFGWEFTGKTQVCFGWEFTERGFIGGELTEKKEKTERRRFEKNFTRGYFGNMQSPKRRSFDFSIHFHGNNERRGPKYNCLIV